MRRYYFIDSNGEDTNLQLYSLKQAKLYWQRLEEELRETSEPEDLHERCVFVIATLGLSVSQLLGQNNPHPAKDVPSPWKAFQAIAEDASWTNDFANRFREFIDAYDHCRHFGVTTSNERHDQVASITVDRTRELYTIGLEVWDGVIEYYRRDPDNDLDELDLENMW